MRLVLIRLGMCNMLASLAVIAAVAGQPPAYAQDKAASAPKALASSAQAGKPEKPRGVLPPYFKGVVDEKQRDAIYTSQGEYAAKIAALKAQLEAVTKERDTKIAAVLTPDQRKKVEQLQTEAKAKRGEQKPAGKTPATGADAKKPGQTPVAK